jgi:hypothetical protein
MHVGDLLEALRPFAIYHESGDARLDAKSAAMAEAFGSPALLIQRGADAPVSGLAYATAASFGIPAILVEDGGAGQYDAGIAQGLLAGVENVLRSLDVLPGGARNLPAPRRFAKFTWVRTREAGFFRHEAKVGDELAAGQRLGRLVDFFGATIEEIVTPEAGRVLFMVVSPAMGKSGLICGIGVGGLDRALSAQHGDTRLVQPQKLAQDLLAMLAEKRRGLAIGDGGGGEAERIGDQIDLALARQGMGHLDPHLAGLDLRIGEDLIDGIDRAAEHAQPGETLDPFLLRLAPQDILQKPIERPAVADPLIGDEARVLGQPAPERRRTSQTGYRCPPNDVMTVGGRHHARARY